MSPSTDYLTVSDKNVCSISSLCRLHSRHSYPNLIGNSRNESTSPAFLHENYLYFLHVPCLLATIICIAGATYLPHSNPSEGETLVRAGWVIFSTGVLNSGATDHHPDARVPSAVLEREIRTHLLSLSCFPCCSCALSTPYWPSSPTLACLIFSPNGTRSRVYAWVSEWNL